MKFLLILTLFLSSSEAIHYKHGKYDGPLPAQYDSAKFGDGFME